MSEPSLEDLFERYRSGGELEALGAVFDRSAPELLVLAAHLVRDPVEAEDLVQSTFVAAIEGARSFERGRRLEPWLAGILARQAARVHRTRLRTPDPARLAHEPEGDPLAHAERSELTRALERGLAELSAPYREVLERYLAGEKPLAIARTSGRAPGSVRMQILRGLERLRRILPAGLYGVVPLARTPRGLSALRAEIVGRAGLALGAGTAVAASSFVGGLLVSSKLVLSMAALAALALVLVLRTQRESTPPVLALQSVSEPVLTEPIELTSAALTPQETARTPAEVDAPAAQGVRPSQELYPVPAGRPGIYLVGELRGLDALEPEDVQITVSTLRGVQAAENGAADGRYAIDITSLTYFPQGAPAALYVTAVHPAGRKTSVEFPLPDAARTANQYETTELRLDLDLRARTAVVGRVQAGEDVERTSIHVALMRPERPAADGERGEDEGDNGPLDEVQCDGEGYFTLYPKRAGACTLVVHTWGVPPLAHPLTLAEGQLTDAGVLVLEAGGVAIEGVVRLPFEAHLDGWRVRASRMQVGEGEPWEGVLLRGGRLSVREGLASLAPDGAFRIPGLEQGTYALQLESEPGPELVLPYPAAIVSPPASGIALGESYGRTRVVVEAQGGDCRGAMFTAEVENGSFGRGANCGEPFDVIADRRMPFSFAVMAPGWKRATAELPLPRALEERVELTLLPNDELASLELDWNLAPGLAPPDWVTASRRRVGEDPGPASKMGFPSSTSSAEDSVRADGNHVRFEHWLPGRYRVTLEPRGRDSWELAESLLCSTPFEVELVAGATAHASVEWTNGGRVRLAPDASRRAVRLDSLQAEVRDASGHSLPVRFTQREYVDGGFSIGSYSGQLPLYGPCELQPSLAPGSYELVLIEAGAELVHVPFAIVGGETIDVAFVVP